MDQFAVAESLQTIAAQAVALARKQGADQAEVGASYEEGLSVTVRMGELESVERQRDRGLAITVYTGTDGRPNIFGLVLLFVGIGYGVLWWFEQRPRQREAAGYSNTYGDHGGFAPPPPGPGPGAGPGDRGNTR